MREPREERDAGSDRSFERFFSDEYVRLCRALYLATGSASEAEELAQEAMVRVFERWSRVAAIASPTGYLYRTAMNLQKSRLRRLAVWRRRVSAPEPVRDPFLSAEDRDELSRLLRALPESLRAALVLVEWVGMSVEEAGRVLRIEPVSVRVRLSRARAALRLDPSATLITEESEGR